MSLSPELALVVDRGAQIITAALDELRGPLHAATGAIAVEYKSDGTPVTPVDLEADRQLTHAISSTFPGHGILSEEQHTVAPDTRWCWVIDPIDGTSNFISGLPYWCVSVALLHEGLPVLSIVEAPALDARYLAAHGRGAQRNGTAIRARGETDVEDPALRHVPLMLTTSTARHVRRSGIRLNPRVMGSTALDMCLVAEGVAAGSLAMTPHVWDMAAGTLLVAEAGGAVATVTGQPLLPVSVGTEYRHRSAVTGAGPSRGWIDDVAGRLLP